MSQSNKDINQTIDTQIKRARVEQLEREAMAQGIKPFDADEWATDADFEGQTLEERQQEVDEFLKDLKEWRSVPSRKELA